MTTLGFRGEALASMAACARLTLTSASAAEGGDPAGPAGAQRPSGAYRLVVEGGRRLALEPVAGLRGTAVDVAQLFFNLPARKRFMKSAASEGLGCRQAFLEKALPHPSVGFRLFVDGELRLFLPAQDPRERVAAAMGLELQHLHVSEGKTTGARALIVAGRPELARRDRKYLHLYVNRRRIADWSLLQAAEYAFGQYVPGGSHPVAFLFLEVDPALVDFNIHPAKKEARFRNLAELRQLIIGTLHGLLVGFGLRAGSPGAGAPVTPAPRGGPGVQPAGQEAWTFEAGAGRAGAAGAPAAGTSYPAPAEQPAGAAAEDGASIHYRGQLFRLFLLVERGDSLFIVDQHAAHERLLFEELKSRRLASQELLLPLRLEGVGEERVRREGPLLGPPRHPRGARGGRGLLAHRPAGGAALRGGGAGRKPARRSAQPRRAGAQGLEPGGLPHGGQGRPGAGPADGRGAGPQGPGPGQCPLPARAADLDAGPPRRAAARRGPPARNLKPYSLASRLFTSSFLA